ncbi:hypothetical protein ZHAS_00005439 [Anopheles sinensis]|uniref:Uncharacterized protein n=1 Tax=Anopheles sinensis TaxID=74873 RepID=A0A084VJK1_ANOSI|nr:hypothetical protein ZHAS_00005439 [Anopheles sinensis]
MAYIIQRHKDTSSRPRTRWLDAAPQRASHHGHSAQQALISPNQPTARPGGPLRPRAPKIVLLAADGRGRHGSTGAARGLLNVIC